MVYFPTHYYYQNYQNCRKEEDQIKVHNSRMRNYEGGLAGGQEQEDRGREDNLESYYLWHAWLVFVRLVILWLRHPTLLSRRGFEQFS